MIPHTIQTSHALAANLFWLLKNRLQNITDDKYEEVLTHTCALIIFETVFCEKLKGQAQSFDLYHYLIKQL
jgi:hypothetical protein